MNERIRQLREQAWALVGDEQRDRGELYEAREQWERCDQKFAELIVRECCLQVADVRIENDFEPVGDAVLVQALAGIKKYFGVEE